MKINQKLINFYNSTHYIFEELNICIKINEICPQLENLLEKHAIDQWAFITAFNPYSKELNENENYTRHLNLIKDVDTFLYFEGIV